MLRGTRNPRPTSRHRRPFPELEGQRATQDALFSHASLVSCTRRYDWQGSIKPSSTARHHFLVHLPKCVRRARWLKCLKATHGWITWRDSMTLCFVFLVVVFCRCFFFQYCLLSPFLPLFFYPFAHSYICQRQSQKVSASVEILSSSVTEQKFEKHTLTPTHNSMHAHTQRHTHTDTRTRTHTHTESKACL